MGHGHAFDQATRWRPTMIPPAPTLEWLVPAESATLVVGGLLVMVLPVGHDPDREECRSRRERDAVTSGIYGVRMPDATASGRRELTHGRVVAHPVRWPC